MQEKNVQLPTDETSKQIVMEGVSWFSEKELNILANEVTQIKMDCAVQHKWIDLQMLESQLGYHML